MTTRPKKSTQSTMLELWRPPQSAGDPIGCLSSTFTFHPGLFEEQCLARFLGMDSDPDREDAAFLLERETRLGSVYAGVLVDSAHAGVPHSLRWDVLAVRVPAGKQHAKVSLLAWADFVRVIVASANLTEPGYRRNFEVAAALEFEPSSCDQKLLESVLAFLREMIAFVPSSSGAPDVVQARARKFLRDAQHFTARWKGRPGRPTIRQRLACSMPGRNDRKRSALDELWSECRTRGSTPHEAWVASPFFDDDATSNQAAAALCKKLARGKRHRLCFCVPHEQADDQRARPRLHAPRSLLTTARNHGAEVSVEMVPMLEGSESRPWHAKMVHCIADEYSALMVGSSNFTCAGLGLTPRCNIEANVVTLVDYQEHGRQEGILERVWPEMTPVNDPDAAEWMGARDDADDDASADRLPNWVLAATFDAGDRRQLLIEVEPTEVPDEWSIAATGSDISGNATEGDMRLLGASEWRRLGSPAIVELPWRPEEPPQRLRVTWGPHAAFLAVNVVDARRLPAPKALEDMTADDMLAILSASDPGAALRLWHRKRRRDADQRSDPDLDTASTHELNPLNNYDLADTFLHRIRARARTMARLQQFVSRPAASLQALEWRLRGLMGIEPLVLKFAAEFEAAADRRPGADPRESLLTLADLLIILQDAQYEPAEGALPNSQFKQTYRPFLRDLATRLDGMVRRRIDAMPESIAEFWHRVVERCKE